MSEPHSSSRLSLSSKGVLLVLAALPAVFATGYTSFEFLRQDVLLVAASLILTIWGVEVLRQRAFKTVALSVLAPLGALSLWALLSSTWSPVPMNGVLDAGLLLSLSALAIPLALPSREPLTWRHIMAATSAGTIAAGVCGLLDASGVGIFSQVWDAPSPTGTFDASEFGVAYYVIALPLSAALVGAKSPVLKILGGLALIMGSVHLALLGASWMALIALAVAMVVPAAALMIHSKKLGQTLSPLVLGAACVVLIATGIGRTQFDHQDEDYNPATSLPVVATHKVLYSPDSIAKKIPRDARFAISRMESLRDDSAQDYLEGITLKAAKDRPLIGQGSGGWWLSQSRFVDMGHPFYVERFDHYPAFHSTHNGYAKVFIEYGVLGLLLLIATFFAAIASFSAPLRAQSASTDVPSPNIHALWGFAASLLAGAIIMYSTSAIELAAPMAVLTAALISLAVTTHGIEVARAATSPSRSIITPLIAVAAAAAMIVMGAIELTAGYYQGKADQLLLYGRFEQAHKDYLKAHDILPVHGENLYNAVLAAWRTGDANEMLPLMEEAVTLRPHDARIYHLKAHLHLMRNEYKDMLNAEKTALSLYPTYLDAYENIHIANDLLMDFENAIKSIEQALTLNPPRKIRTEMHTRAASIYGGPAANPAKAIYHLEKVIPLLDNRVAIEQLSVQLEETKKRVERERLRSEGKPIPSDLMPVKETHDHNHVEDMLPPGIKPPAGHDNHDGHDH